MGTLHDLLLVIEYLGTQKTFPAHVQAAMNRLRARVASSMIPQNSDDEDGADDPRRH